MQQIRQSPSLVHQHADRVFQSSDQAGQRLYRWRKPLNDAAHKARRYQHHLSRHPDRQARYAQQWQNAAPPYFAFLPGFPR